MSQDDGQIEYNYDTFEGIPIRAMNTSSRSILSQSLNIEQVIPSKEGYRRDYRGLAQLMEFSYNDLVTVQRSNDPMKVLLDSYQSTLRGGKCTIKNVLLMLETIGRYDVIDDVLESLVKDVEAYKERERKLAVFRPSQEMDNLTIDDQADGKSMYDAYVCYADPDLDFVVFLTKFLESPSVNLKLYIRERDPLIGNMETDGFVEVLQSRCKRMLIILSPDFLSSNECVFQSNVAQALATNERKSRMLIPIVYERCEVPASINMLTKVDLTRGNLTRLDWIWKRLVSSLAGPDRVKSMNFQHLTAEYLAFLENNPKSKSCELSHQNRTNIPQPTSSTTAVESLIDRLPSPPSTILTESLSPSTLLTESLPPSYSEIYFPKIPSGPPTNVSTVSSSASLVPSKGKKHNWLTSLKNKITRTTPDGTSTQCNDGDSSRPCSLLEKQ